MIRVIRLNETVFRKGVPVASLKKIIKRAKEIWLVLQKVYDLHRRTRFVVVEEFASVLRVQQAIVDAFVLLALVKDIHADLAEGGAVVCKGAVTNRRTWN